MVARSKASNTGSGSPLSSKSTSNRTEQTLPQRKHNERESGHRIVCWSILQRAGLACAKYVRSSFQPALDSRESVLTHPKGGEKYQSAFYVFEELATSAQSQSPHSLVAQAVSELHLGRLPEAEAALQQAIAIDPNSADTIANLIVLNTLLGRKDETTQLKDQLKSAYGEHRALKDWTEKKEEFAKAAAKYTPKFEVAA